jgi:hypothetical protein
VVLRDVYIDYCVTAILFDSATSWSEGCSLENVLIHACTTGISFVKQAGGTGSFAETHFSSVFISGCSTGISIGTGANLFRSSWTNVVVWLDDTQTGLSIDGTMTGALWQISFEASGSGAGTTGIVIGANVVGSIYGDVIITWSGPIATQISDPSTKGFVWRTSAKDTLSINSNSVLTFKGDSAESILFKKADDSKVWGLDTNNKWLQLVNGTILRLFSGAYSGLKGQWRADTGLLQVDTISEVTADAGTTVEGVKALDSFLELTEIAKPGNPAANKLRLYVKDKAGVSTLYYLKDDGTEVEVGAGGGGGANVALDNLAGVAINTSLISDADSTDDLGSSSKYWRYGYLDRLYLNASAYFDGATAGRAALTGGLSLTDVLSVGGAPLTNTGITYSPVGQNLVTGAYYYLYLNPSGSSVAAGQTVDISGVYGVPAYVLRNGATASLAGLYFAGAVAVGYGGETATASVLVGVKAGMTAIINAVGGVLNVTSGVGLYVEAPQVAIFAGTINFASYKGLYIANPASNQIDLAYGIHIPDITAATGGAAPTCRILELGPTPYLRLLGSGSWTPAANETPLFLVEGTPGTLRQAKWKAGNALGAGDKVLVLV